MDIQKQIAFEKSQAKDINCDYEELKQRLDRCEKLSGHRYLPTSPRHEAWLVWDAAWQAAQAVPEGFVLVEKKEFEQMQEFEDLYRIAIFNSKKSIHEVNWSHVSNLGVGSTRAKAMCKRFNIDPEATFRKTQEPTND